MQASQYKFLFLVTFFLFLNTILPAQSFLQDSLASATHHHTPWDILSGNGDDELVCYKQAHRNMYFVVTGLVILIALIAIRLLRLNKKTNKKLKKINEIIEEKNKNITDSINYAKRIQQLLLPTDKSIDKTLKRLKKE